MNDYWIASLFGINVGLITIGQIPTFERSVDATDGEIVWNITFRNGLMDQLQQLNK